LPRPLLRELAPAILLSLLLLALWWWFNGRESEAPPPLPPCNRPVEIRLQGGTEGYLIACTPEEYQAALERLELASSPSLESPVLSDLYAASGSACRVTLDSEGAVVRIEEGILSGQVAQALGWPLDLNRVLATDLEALPGVGPSLAKAIVADRETNGPYCSVSDLARVKGVGDSFLRQHASSLKASCP